MNLRHLRGSAATVVWRAARSPVRDFLQIEASGGLLLILATVVALVWANSPWQESYESFIHFHISFEFGSFLTIDERSRRGSTMP